jgi:hypothetical protein
MNSRENTTATSSDQQLRPLRVSATEVHVRAKDRTHDSAEPYPQCVGMSSSESIHNSCVSIPQSSRKPLDMMLARNIIVIIEESVASVWVACNDSQHFEVTVFTKAAAGRQPTTEPAAPVN